MKYITKPWSRFLISLFAGSILSELIFISTGDPNRHRGDLEHITPVICISFLYFIFTYLTDRTTIKFTEILNNDEISPLNIYSKSAILICSFFFSPIFAGSLLRQNLIAVQKKNTGNLILFISLVLTVISVNTVIRVLGNASLFIYLSNFFCSFILTEYIFSKYLRQGNYIYKKVWNPLLIAISICLGLILLNVLLRR